MDTAGPKRPTPITTEELMRYLDGESSPEERERVERGLESSTELQRELAMYRALKSDIQDLSFPPVNARNSVWDQVNTRLNRPFGWILLISGLVIWMVYGSWVFTTSTASPWEKIGTGAIAIGMLMLLASVIWERLRELETDPYRNVQR
jgi:anti-sigma factor RsiW